VGAVLKLSNTGCLIIKNRVTRDEKGGNRDRGKIS